MRTNIETPKKEQEKTDSKLDELYDEEVEEEKFTPKMLAGLAIGTVVLVGIFSIVLWNILHIKDTNSKDEVLSEFVSDTAKMALQYGSEQIEVMTEDDETGDESNGDITGDVGNEESISDSETMGFKEDSDTVTAKDVTNLRTEPSTADGENIVAQLLNGETLTRTGINVNTGWSRLEYNGEIVYAVTNYLTTDLTYKPPVEPDDPNRIVVQDGRVIIFENQDDYVAPKEYVNLRTEPSTSQGEATVRCQIHYGTVVHRTGYSADSGWSRVEYNGEILYVVSSMIYTVEAPQ